MEDGPFVWVLVVFALAIFLYKQFLIFTRDVPDEYLNEQSVVESIRNPNELAIHKSTKLDYSQGLRIGLGIRYGHYKLRNGNLYDVWELAMGHVKKDPSKMVDFDGKPVSLTTLNGQAQGIREALLDLALEKKLDELRIHTDLVFTDADVFSVIIACFTSQITVHIHDGSVELDENLQALDLKKKGGALAVYEETNMLINISDLISRSTASSVFQNEYSFEKDRGIALKVTCRINHKASVRTDFTQTNLVSAVACCIKQLPPHKEIGTHDRVAVIQDKTSVESLVNGLTKTMVALVCGSQLIIASDLKACLSQSPTIILASTRVVERMNHEPEGFDKLLKLHRLYSLSSNRFSGLVLKKPYPDLRLLIAHRSINSSEVSPDWRQMTASLVSRVMEEIGYFNVAGPILVTDYYDTRKFSNALSSQTRTYGAVAQSNEIKLIDFDGKSSGRIVVRGYNIGKARTILRNVGENLVLPDQDGFYDLSVTGSWGLDGCLYVKRL